MISDMMNDPDADYLTGGGQASKTQGMAQQYSGNYGQDSKHSVMGTLIGMVPGYGQAIQSMMPDGQSGASSYITGNAAQNAGGGATPFSGGSSVAEGAVGISGLIGGGASGASGSGGATGMTMGGTDLTSQLGGPQSGGASMGLQSQGIGSLLQSNPQDNYNAYLMAMQGQSNAPSPQASFMANNYNSYMG